MTTQVIDPFENQDAEIDDDNVVEDDTLPAPEPLYVIPSRDAPPPTHTQKTRKMLALVLLLLLGILYIAIYAFFLPGNLAVEKMNTAIVGLSGIQALAGAAVGFYYGTKDKNKS